MAQFSRTWWGKKFIEALEEFSDSARLGRGRSYAHNGKIKEHQITKLDRDPFLLFELRGISRSRLQQELAKSPLGKALSSALDEGELPIIYTASYHTKPQQLARPLPVTSKDFWQGEKRLPQTVVRSEIAAIPAVVVKKGGNFPPFWMQDNSFLAVMEELYDRVRKKNT